MCISCSKKQCLCFNYVAVTLNWIITGSKTTPQHDATITMLSRCYYNIVLVWKPLFLTPHVSVTKSPKVCLKLSFKRMDLSSPCCNLQLSIKLDLILEQTSWGVWDSWIIPDIPNNFFSYEFDSLDQVLKSGCSNSRNITVCW